MSNAETKPYETKVVSEQQAAAFREMLLQLKRELGDDGYHNFAIELAEQYERMLRENCPEHPILEMLDRHRERESSRRA